jgi:hypothetical protein
MADKPIVTIDVDDSQFQGFVERFDKYRESVRDQPHDWAALGKGLKSSEGSFEKLALSVSGVTRALVNPRLETVFGTFSKLSTSVSKSWDAVAKSIEKSSKNISVFSRMTLGAGASVAKIAGIGFGVAAGVVGAVTGAASSLSDQNRENRGLNIKPGEAEAFKDQYGVALGVDSSFIEKIARMQADASQHSKLSQITAGGVSETDIQSQDPTELAIAVLRESAKAKQSLGPNWATYSGAYDAIGFQTLNNAANRPFEFWGDRKTAFDTERDKTALDPSKYDAGTDFTQHQAANWNELKSAFESAAIVLAPALTKFSDSATELALQLAKGLPGAVKKIADIADKINPLLPSLGRGSDPLDDAAIGIGQTVTDEKKWAKLKDAVSKSKGIQKGGQAQPFKWDWHHPFGTLRHDDTKPAQSQPAAPGASNDFGGVEAKFNLPTGVMRVIRKLESNGDDRAENPVTHAQGPFQIMPDNSKRMGIDPFNVEQASLAAGEILKGQLDKFHGNMGMALAGYDGDTHIESDAAKFNGKWLQGAKDETIAYLSRAMKEGVDTGLDASDTKYIAQRMSAQIAKLAKPRYQDLAEATGQGGNYQFQMPVRGERAAPHVFSLNVSAPPGMNVNLSAGQLVQ